MRHVFLHLNKATDISFDKAQATKKKKFHHVNKEDKEAGHKQLFSPFVFGADGILYSETMKVIEGIAQLNPDHHHDPKEIALRIRASLYNSILPIARLRVYKYPREHLHHLVPVYKGEIFTNRRLHTKDYNNIGTGAQPAAPARARGSIPRGMISNAYNIKRT